MLAAIGKRAEGWIARTNGLVGEGCALYRAVVDADLEGLVAKRLGDACHPQLARWQKVLNQATRSVTAVPNGFASAVNAHAGHWLKI